MSESGAALIHYLILGAGVVTWLFALLYHRRAFRPVDPRTPELLRKGDLDVPAPLDSVREKAVEALRTGGMGGAGTVLLTSVEERRIEAEATWFAPRGKQGTARARFEVDLTSLGGSTGVEYRIFASGGGGLRLASALFVYVLGPAALIAAAILVPRFIIPHENPEVRWQAIQTIHVVHVLWEPFLFGFLRRRVTTVVETALSNLLKNTAF